ncbi:MAG TPA: glycogen-binding domain-containing protein [Candidatus Bathyarchaeia archaeon]|nr:glycogen-binding domain-containing protein [Candidatus Bathyarchaeia archaeon]
MAPVSCARFLERSLGTPLVKGDTVTFRVKVPSARTVQLAGDWPRSNWARGDAESGEVLVGLMEKAGDGGVWRLSVRLGPGRYRYLFLVNETEWFLDPENPRVVDDGRGGKANLLIVP